MRTSQTAECQTAWGLLSAKLKTIAHELGQERTQLIYYKDILLNDNCHKIFKKLIK